MIRDVFVSATVQTIMSDIANDGTVYVHAMTYTKDMYTTARIPAETAKGRKKERLSNALIRGLREEVAEKGDEHNFVAARGTFSFVQVCDDEDEQDGFHAKIAIEVKHIAGKLRSKPARDEDNPDELHGPIVKIEVGELIENGLEGYPLLIAHKISLCAYLRYLSVSNREVAMKYYGILDNQRFREKTLTEAEERQVSEYIAG